MFYEVRDLLRKNTKISIENANKISEEIYQLHIAEMQKDRNEETAKFEREKADLLKQIEELKKPSKGFTEQVFSSIKENKSLFEEMIHEAIANHIVLETGSNGGYGSDWRSTIDLLWDNDKMGSTSI